jgi:superfamily II DNA or RNA helicase
MISVESIDETYIRIVSENKAILQTIFDVFTFEVPGYQHMPAFKRGIWSGKIHLFNLNSGLLYRGLYEKLLEILNKENCDFIVDSKLQIFKKKIPDVTDFAKSLGTSFVPRPYQIKGFNSALEKGRAIIVMPTGSGKSFVIYLLSEYFKQQKKKILIIVPLISLVDQMSKDIKEYSSDSFKTFNIKGGIDPVDYKSLENDAVISTWQSIYKQPKTWFNQFDCIIGDEAHLFKSKSLTTILEKSTQIKYRFGFTGTLDGSKTNEMVLNGLFGQTKNIVTTSELISDNVLSKLKINILQLNYSERIKKMQYLDEIEYVISHKKRNDFIAQLALTLKGNTLVLFSYVEKHGVPLFELIKEKNINPNKPIYYVSGKVKSEERELIRTSSNNDTNAVIVANYSVFSTGINIVNLHNIILAAPTKSQIRVLQSIGRCLRKSYQDANIYDIVDNLNKTCYSIKHANERNTIYIKQSFDYKRNIIKL